MYKISLRYYVYQVSSVNWVDIGTAKNKENATDEIQNC